MPRPPAPARAVLFDADGVLVDSHAGYRRVWDDWSALHGLDPDVVHAATHGRRVLDTLAEVAPHLDPVVEHARLTQFVEAEPDAFPVYPGAGALLRRLDPRAWAVVTSGDADRVRERLRAAGAPLPHVLVDGAAVARGKPDPEGYLLAGRLLGAAPSDCVVVEDVPAGVAAARTAGMPAVALTTSHPAAALAHADVVVGSLTQAEPHVLSWVAGGPLVPSG